jgi:hypothetical protein
MTVRRIRGWKQIDIHPRYCGEFEITDDSSELWIDISTNTDWNPITASNDLSIKKIVFFDWLHTTARLRPNIVELVKQTQQYFDTTWYTLNAVAIPGIHNQKRFDFLWNRCKSAYYDHAPSWKQIEDCKLYTQYPLNFNLRTHGYLNLNRGNTPYRKRLYQFLNQYSGFQSFWADQVFLPNENFSNTKYPGNLLPPEYYLQNSYVSCQVESQYEGANSIVFTEKTYDHLIQGQIVLNFGPCGFYQALTHDGWKLPKGIDFGWDLIKNTNCRFLAYLDCLAQLFKQPIPKIHDWYLSNKDAVEHNYNRLATKPYSVIE